MASIRTVELEALNLSSLYGLGAGNKVVRLMNMESLEDINALKDCLTISITDCQKKFVKTHTNLQHVKQLSLSLENEEQFESFLTSNLLRLPFEEEDEEEEEVSSFYDNFRILAKRYPKVNKFSLKLVGFNVISTDYMKEMFVIDCSRQGYLVLFRK